MNRTFAFAIFWTMAIILLFPGSRIAAAQQGKGDQSKAKASGSLIIGTVAGERGTTAAIPIYYEPAKDTHLRSVHLELDFVSNSVKFAKAEKGVAAEGADFDVAVEAKELPPDSKKIVHTRLSVNMSVPQSASGKSLPQGLLTFLNFSIPLQAKPFSISLTPITITAEDTSSRPVEIAAEAGKIIVSIPDAPLAGCFFFTH